MKFKRGDLVKVVSKSFIKENFRYSKAADAFIDPNGIHIRREMFAFCDGIFEIESTHNISYSLVGADWFWSSQMLRPAVSLNSIYD